MTPINTQPRISQTLMIFPKNNTQHTNRSQHHRTKIQQNKISSSAKRPETTERNHPSHLPQTKTWAKTLRLTKERDNSLVASVHVCTQFYKALNSRYVSIRNCLMNRTLKNPAKMAALSERSSFHNLTFFDIFPMPYHHCQNNNSILKNRDIIWWFRKHAFCLLQQFKRTTQTQAWLGIIKNRGWTYLSSWSTVAFACTRVSITSTSPFSDATCSAACPPKNTSPLYNLTLRP